MVKVIRSFPAPESLAEEAKKAHGEYNKPDVIERLKKDFGDRGRNRRHGIMKIQYRHQKFQADAAKTVVDVFAEQPHLTPTYRMDRDRGSGNDQIGFNEERDFTGFGNQKAMILLPKGCRQKWRKQQSQLLFRASGQYFVWHLQQQPPQCFTDGRHLLMVVPA